MTLRVEFWSWPKLSKMKITYVQKASTPLWEKGWLVTTPLAALSCYATKVVSHINMVAKLLRRLSCKICSSFMQAVDLTNHSCSDGSSLLRAELSIKFLLKFTCGEMFLRHYTKENVLTLFQKKHYKIKQRRRETGETATADQPGCSRWDLQQLTELTSLLSQWFYCWVCCSNRTTVKNIQNDKTNTKTARVNKTASQMATPSIKITSLYSAFV